MTYTPRTVFAGGVNPFPPIQPPQPAKPATAKPIRKQRELLGGIVLQWMRTHKECTAGDISSHYGYDVHSVRKAMHRIKAAGTAEMVITPNASKRGGRPTHVYSLSEGAQP